MSIQFLKLNMLKVFIQFGLLSNGFEVNELEILFSLARFKVVFD